jgi:acyl dehydratase
MKPSTVPTFDSITVGDSIPDLVLPSVTRHALALYCGASGDHNPLHVDIDFAKKSGLPDVIAHGMLSMAWLGRAVTEWVPQRCLRDYGVRFAAMTQIGDVITCGGKVVEKLQAGGENRVRLELQACNQRGEVTLAGHAVVALD